MPTVKEMLDAMRAGQMTLDEVAAEFAAREWKPPRAASDDDAWGEADDDAPDDDSWETVNACHWLDPAQYKTLSAAAVAKP